MKKNKTFYVGLTDERYDGNRELEPEKKNTTPTKRWYVAVCDSNMVSKNNISFCFFGNFMDTCRKNDLTGYDLFVLIGKKTHFDHNKVSCFANPFRSHHFKWAEKIMKKMHTIPKKKCQNQTHVLIWKLGEVKWAYH